jgi:hypothetical protein
LLERHGQSDESMSAQNALKLQMELMQLKLDLESTGKSADKASHGARALIKN